MPLHRCNAIIPKKTAKILPSSEISREKLNETNSILVKYKYFCTESKIATLATKLAREAFFGEKVMARCTVSGCREYYGLPTRELSQLKQTIFSLLPQYWPNPLEFEPTWVSCTESIRQGCKRARHESFEQ